MFCLKIQKIWIFAAGGRISWSFCVQKINDIWWYDHLYTWNLYAESFFDGPLLWKPSVWWVFIVLLWKHRFFKKRKKEGNYNNNNPCLGAWGGRKTQIQQWRRGHSAAGEKETQQQNVVGINRLPFHMVGTKRCSVIIYPLFLFNVCFCLELCFKLCITKPKTALKTLKQKWKQIHKTISNEYLKTHIYCNYSIN